MVVMLCVRKVSTLYSLSYKESMQYNKMSFTVDCENLNNPNNGVINCSLGNNEEYACNFTCNTGYELTGSDTRTCQSNGSWSGSDVVCRKGECCYRPF